MISEIDKDGLPRTNFTTCVFAFIASHAPGGDAACIRDLFLHAHFFHRRLSDAAETRSRYPYTFSRIGHARGFLKGT